MIGHDKEDYYDQLKTVQRNLFTLQTLLATEDAALYARLPQLEDKEVATLESQIDAISAQLPQLHNFVVAGGSAAGAQCHVCRTVCRRAERRTVTLASEANIDASIMRYLNRLSDYLFVLSRRLVLMDGKLESIYEP